MLGARLHAQSDSLSMLCHLFPLKKVPPGMAAPTVISCLVGFLKVSGVVITKRLCSLIYFSFGW